MNAVERYRKVERKPDEDIRVIDAIVLPPDFVLKPSANGRRLLLWLSAGIAGHARQNCESLESVDVLRCAIDVRQAISIDNVGVGGNGWLYEGSRALRGDAGDG